jgi:hypothetical protein
MNPVGAVLYKGASMLRQPLIVMTSIVAASGVLIATASHRTNPAQVSGVVTMHASPSVEATITTLDDAFQFLVLWRGTPGWGTGTHRDRTGGGGDGTISIDLNRGSLSLALWLSPATHQARLQNRLESVPDGTNVLFIDNADGPRPAIVRTLSVDIGSANFDFRKGSIAPLLKSSPEIVEYLRCDLEAPIPPAHSEDVAKLMAKLSKGFCDQIKSQH